MRSSSSFYSSPKAKVLKKIILYTLITLTSFACFSQSDAYITVTYKGYVNGQYVLKVDSKQLASCNPDIQIEYIGITPTAISPNPKNSLGSNQIVGSSTTFYVTAPLSSHAGFNIKALSVCQWQGENPKTVHVDMTALLPLIFQAPPSITHIYEDYFTVEFSVGTQSSIKVYNVQVSRNNGLTWETYAVVAPDNSVLSKTYLVNVKFNQ